MQARMTGPTMPRAPMLIGAALVIFTLFVTDVFGLVGGADASQSAPPVVTRDLRFEDRADGAIVARQAASGAEVMVFDPGTNGFVRGTLRALARGRRQADLSHDAPFRLSAFGDGRLVLEDTLNGRTVELNAFGDTNKDVFATLLAAAEKLP